MATQSLQWPTVHKDSHQRSKMRPQAQRPPTSPTSVWTLLGTIAVTWITMLGVILWQAAPAFSIIVLSGFLIACVSMVVATIALKLISHMAHPALVRRTETAA